VAPRHRDVIHPDLAVVTTAHFKPCHLVGKHKHVHSAGSVPLKRQGLHHQVVRRLRLLKVNEFVDRLADTENVRVGVLAELAFKVLPKDAVNVSRLFDGCFHVKPVFEALKVNEAHTPSALARHDTRVFFRAVGAPAVFALPAVCLVLLLIG
jgi:hypothetical protein